MIRYLQEMQDYELYLQKFILQMLTGVVYELYAIKHQDVS